MPSSLFHQKYSMTLREDAATLPDTELEKAGGTDMFVQGDRKDIHTILSFTKDLPVLVKANDIDGIVYFFKHTDQLNAYQAMESLPLDIEEKVLPQLSSHTLAYLFNNFHGKLPGGYQSKFYADLSQANGESELDTIKKNNNEAKGYSKQYSSITFAEFYDDIKKAAEENGIHIDEIFGEKDSLENPHTPTRVTTELLVPIYIALRKKGYNHKELTE